MTAALQFSGDCNSEKIFKIGQYLTKLCVEHLGVHFFGPPCISKMAVSHVSCRFSTDRYEISPTYQ